MFNATHTTRLSRAAAWGASTFKIVTSTTGDFRKMQCRFQFLTLASEKRVRMKRILVATVLLGLGALQIGSSAEAGKQNWTHFVRIGAWGLHQGDAQRIVREAEESHVFGIEVDNDISGRYESFLDPAEKLNAIHAVADAAHKAGNRAFVYIAGTECITAHADKTSHTMAKDHPEWLQRKITGEPAIFGGGTAFWIHKGDEDVWISPYASEWRKIYMQRVRQIAGTGIDGIYVDIPYWMTHFDGWENSWASFDDYTVDAFKKQTGLDAKNDLKLGDFADPHFRQWVEFRIQTITDFMAEIDRTAKEVNPEIKTIPEIYPGIEEEAVRVGADVYSLYPVVDAIAHEYEFGEGDNMASSRTPLDWFRYQVGMQSFRSFAAGKATWILNYSWDGDGKVDKRESMQNLAMSQIMTGANFWDAPGHTMAGSNDLPTREKIFAWIKQHEETFFHPRAPIRPIGVYFSPSTRNFLPHEFIPSYQGVLILLMQKHLEYQILTPRTLRDFTGETLILPDVQILGDAERSALRALVSRGGKLIVTGHDATQLPASPRLVRLPDCPGKSYMMALNRDFTGTTPDVAQEFFLNLPTVSDLTVKASPSVATHIARVDGLPHIFFANFKGLVGGRNPIPSPETNAHIVIAGSARVYFLPFLGETEELQGKTEEGKTTFVLPPIKRGAVLWLKLNESSAKVGRM
jgi:hypothetical protein